MEPELTQGMKDFAILMELYVLLKSLTLAANGRYTVSATFVSLASLTRRYSKAITRIPCYESTCHTEDAQTCQNDLKIG